jgi:hypothetical protein
VPAFDTRYPGMVGSARPPQPIQSPEQLAGKYLGGQPDYTAQARQQGQAFADANRPQPPSPAVASSLGISGPNYQAIAAQANGPRAASQGGMMASRPPTAIGMQVASPANRPIGLMGQAAPASPVAPRPWGQNWNPENFRGFKGEKQANIGVQGQPSAPPAIGVQAPAQSPERAAYVQAAAQSAMRYNNPGLAQRAGIEAGLEYDDRLAQRDMDRHKMDMDKQKMASDNAISPEAKMYMAALQGGMAPGEANALVARFMPKTQAPNVGIAGGPAGPQNIGVQGDPETVLRNSPTGVWDTIQGSPTDNPEGLLSKLADSGIDFTGDPGLAAAMKQKMLSQFGQQGMADATAQPYGHGAQILSDFPAASGFGTLFGPVEKSKNVPRLLRTMLQPLNYALGGTGTSYWGDPVQQESEREKRIALWNKLNGVPSPTDNPLPPGAIVPF